MREIRFLRVGRLIGRARSAYVLDGDGGYYPAVEV